MKKHNIVDPLIDRLNADQTDQLNRIICGDVEEQYDDPIFENYAGLYYFYKKDGHLAEQHLLRAFDIGSTDSMCNLGNVYKEQKKYDHAEHYYKLAIDHNVYHATNNLGYMYKQMGKYDLAEKYLMQAVDLGNILAMHNLGFMCIELGKYDQAERYYQQAVDLGNVGAMHNLGHVYNQIGKYDLAERYYLQAIDLGNVGAMHNLGFMYHIHLEKYDLAERYLLMALEHGKDDLEPTIMCLSSLIRNPLRLFVVLDRLKSSNDAVVQKLKELMNNQTVRYFANKRSRLSKDGECPVCYDVVRLIPRECAHYYCEDCYVRIERCCFGCDNE